MSKPGSSHLPDPDANINRGQMSSPSGLQIDTLTLEEVGAANRAAQIDGIMAGACAGFIGSFMSTKVFKQNRNIGLLSGLLTAVACGYFFTQASLSTHLAKASSTSLTLRNQLREQSLSSNGRDADDSERLSMKRSWGNEKEGGSQGLEMMHDKYASTKGDH